MDCKHHYLDGAVDRCSLKERDELMKSEVNAQLFLLNLNTNNTDACELADGTAYKKCPFYESDFNR